MKPDRFGFFSFTEVTDPAEHRSYNEWHQLDHLPEQFPLAGDRLRAALGVDARVPRRAGGERARARPDPLRHLLPDGRADRGDARRLLRARCASCTGSTASTSTGSAHLTGPFRVVGTAAAPRVLVSAAAVPFRAHRGIYVIVEEDRQSVSRAEYERWLDAEHLPRCWPRRASPGSGRSPPVPTSRRDVGRRARAGSRCAGSTTTPLAVAARLAPLVADRRERFDATAHLTFAGPFETITPWEWDWFDAP